MRTRYRKTGWLCALLAAVLCLALALPQSISYARDLIDESKTCTLKVRKTAFDENIKKWTDLDLDTEIEVYLYQIATIDPYGRYTWKQEFIEAEVAYQEKLGDEYPNPVDWDLQELNNGVYKVSAEDWEKEAYYIAAVLGLPVPPKEEEASDKESLVIPDHETLVNTACYSANIKADEEILLERDKWGMYLVWAKPFVTNQYEYSFLPYLVSVPDNAYHRNNAEGLDTSVDTDSDEWLYQVTVGLKPSRKLRYLNLEIVKSLENYNEASGKAMFAFQVDARKDLNEDGKIEEHELVYSDVFGLDFSQSGQKRVLVKKIPVGSVVTVREIYSGSSYKLTGWTGETGNPDGAEVLVYEDGTVVIDKLLGSSGQIKGEIDEDGIETAAKVTFVNDYDPDGNYGSGIVNHFTYTEGENGLKTWQGVKLTDNQEGGAANE